MNAGLKIVITLVISVVIVCCEKCDNNGYTRVKRAKFYSNPPPRYYRRPVSYSFPVKGVYSNTPPPSYMTDNEDSYPPGIRPKVSKKPTAEGLGDEDINNIVKYLSKQDLDKIIEFASEKDKYNKESIYEYPSKDDRNKNYKANLDHQYKDVSFEYINNPDDNFQTYKNSQGNVGPVSARPGPYSNNQIQPYDIEYERQQESIAPRIVNSNPNLNSVDIAPFDVQESMQNGQKAFYNNENIRRPINNDVRELYTDSKVMKEEDLPKPVNLREEDYYGDYSNNVAKVVKADSSLYKVESFGELPLMNYNSKLESVSSYHVPHYTVTTNKKPSYGAPSPTPSSSSSDVPLEPAPPVSEAKAQSDAHLKATKIWTHKSKGTAYYLHSDGTLSLEKPQRPKSYGP